jgi:hypothetical protein
MESQGLSQGSLRNSHRETHAIRRKPAPASFHEPVRRLVESSTEDLVIRQRLDPEKSETLLKKGQFYLLENEGRGEPGFLVFLPGKPAIYYQLKRNRPPIISTLRMRVSPTVAEGGGSVLIATLDDVLHTLRIEDVWTWRGEALFAKQPYSQRREKLKEFVERHWIPDARLLGGIFTRVANPISLEKFVTQGAGALDGMTSVEFIPEQAGRRRMVFSLEEQVRAASGPAGLKHMREDGARVGAPIAPPVAPTQTPVPVSMPTNSRRAKAIPVDKMPDVYDLFGEDGFPISRASVQQFSLSQQIRAAFQDQKEVWVLAAWRPDFGGYEIQGIATK